jgi:hypothetical protein
MRCPSAVLWPLCLLGLVAPGAVAQPANDNPCLAVGIPNGITEREFTTVGATANNLPLDCQPGLNDVWFSCSLQDALMISVTPSGATPLPKPAITVYSEPNCAFFGLGSAPLACSEELFVNGVQTATLHINRPTRLPGGTTYYIRVASGVPGSTGTATLRTTTDTTFATSTYQGQLKENGAPANGAYDIELATFNAPTGGTSLAVTTNSGVTVTDGLFTCPLKLNPNITNGQDLYVEARVRASGSGQAFTTLSPRQRLLSVPHALMASESHFAHTAEWDGLLHMPEDFKDGVDDLRSLSGNGNSNSAARSDHQHTSLVNSTSAGSIAVQVDLGGEVGIGTITPAARLHVQEGASGVSPSTTTSAAFERSGTNYVQILSPDASEKGVAFGSPLSGFAGGMYYTNATGMNFRTGTNDTQMTIDPTGLVGIGRTPATNRLEVNGNASKSASGSWLANSDARIKQDIEPVTGALATLGRVNLVSFRYTPQYRATHDGLTDRRYLNVIAQQFQTVFPDWVQSSGEKLADGSEILQVDTYPLTIYSAAAVQELHSKVRDLESRLSAKEKQAAEQESRLRALEAAIRASERSRK